MKMPVYEVWEYAGDTVKRIAMCGNEEDARMMMRLLPEGKSRSWIKCEEFGHLYCTEGDK